MERKFEEISKMVQGVLELFDKEIKDAEDTANKIMADWRFSPAGKENAKKDVYTDLQAKADNLTKLLKEAIQDFCDTYRVKLPSDGKDHGMDIANALKVIDMLGFNMTVETLKTILEPVKNSYIHMKMIADVIFTKNDAVSSAAVYAGVHYDSAVISLIQQYLGVNTKVFDYLNLFRDIEEIGTVDGYKLGFSATNYTNGTVVTITPKVPYAVLSLSDWMIRAGEMYAELENEFTELFKEHTPTDQEIIESVLKTQ